MLQTMGLTSTEIWNKQHATIVGLVRLAYFEFVFKLITVFFVNFVFILVF